MEFIKLNRIEHLSNGICYVFSTSTGLSKYFSGKDFIIEYPEDISTVPDSVLAIPFVACILPIIWLTNSKLALSELDEDFYHCIPKIKKGYEEMYPESVFGGEIDVIRVVKNERKNDAIQSAMLFSGGVDSVYTLLQHMKEKPKLVAIWGSDIRYDNFAGWNRMYSTLQLEAKKVDLSVYSIRSSFRDYDNEGMLDRIFQKQLKSGWWYGVKHGIALLGHLAPMAYNGSWSQIYIASSNWPEVMPDRCASDPSIDNYVAFAGCHVSHDGFPLNRQEKVHQIVKTCNSLNKKINLHVCWESQSGENCCQCEKCYRTMANLMVEEANPLEFGFQGFSENEIRGKMQNLLYQKLSRGLSISDTWPVIAKNIDQNELHLRKSKYWKCIKWLKNVDFNQPETLKLPLLYRIRSVNGIRSKLAEFSFYQKLHDIKNR